MPRGDNNRKLSDEQRDEVVERYTTPLANGTWVGVPTIAKQYGVANFAIQTLLRKRGINTRTSKEAWGNGKRAWVRRELPDEPPPRCKCGCGEPTVWNRKKWSWTIYAPGHYTQRNSQNPHWNGGTAHLSYPHDWRDIARAIRKRDAFTCQDCRQRLARESGRLHVHHINGNRMDNTATNLVTLCVNCHGRRHGQGD